MSISCSSLSRSSIIIVLSRGIILTDKPDENKDTENDKTTDSAPKPKLESDLIKKGVGLGAIVLGVYMLDRLLGEEKTVLLRDNTQMKIRKGFLEEFLE
jgi:hypothetical protein